MPKKMGSQYIRRFFQRTVPVVSVLVLLFSALYFAGDATRGVSGFADYYLWVLALTGLALLVLFVAIVNRIRRLAGQLRASAPGSRLTLRLVIIFVALALPPALVVYAFSVDFLHRSVDSWFDVEVESAFSDALDIGRAFLTTQEINAQAQTRRLTRALRGLSDNELLRRVPELMTGTNALQLTIISPSGRVLATSSRELEGFEPDYPPDYALFRARQSEVYVSAEPVVEGVMQIRVLMALSDPGLASEARILQGIYPVAQGYDAQADNVERQAERYQRLFYLRTQLKRSFILILSLVLLLSVLMAVLLAFNTAKKLVQPIGRLADATRAIAAGDYQRQLPVPSNDELGFLVASFNTMTQKIGVASAAAIQSREEAETRRDYLEAVLGRLSSGVISIDDNGALVTANPAAAQILNVSLQRWLGQPLHGLSEAEIHLAPLTKLIAEKRAEGAPEWRQELVLDTGGQQQVLVCRGAQLGATAGVKQSGQVVIFDDMSGLVRAQREAAWGEVARRLAHEVKNPLTPIQLAAERLRRKYLEQMAPDDAELLDRSTRTIVTQVEALKTMVNAFSEYARAPTLQLEPSRLSELVGEVLDLYRQSDHRLLVRSQWMESEPYVFTDRVRMRQLLHNLVKNAQEAVEGPLELDIAAHLEWQQGHALLCLSIRDNGPGLPSEIINKLFEPYATTKTRGTGIGLAIVKKIAEEHGGEVTARNAASGGAVFELRLPVEPAQLQAARLG